MDAARAIRHIYSETIRVAIESGDRGAIVRGLRQARQLTLAQLAARCGYSISTLSRMERGKQALTDIRVLRSLAEALGVSRACSGRSGCLWLALVHCGLHGGRRR
ncbi:MAG: helix-turn-helix domain-containing protein [Pseudonocardiaceae bacterium]